MAVQPRYEPQLGGLTKMGPPKDGTATAWVHPLGFNKFRFAASMIWENRAALNTPWAWYLAANSLAVSPLLAPTRWLEQARYGRQFADAKVQSPVFILGHWRSGTTHLHNLFCQDEQFGWVTTFQALMPNAFLVTRGNVERVIGAAMPETRMFDNIKLSPNSPQEEEYALCNFTKHNFYHTYYFPARFQEMIDRYCLFEGPDAALDEAGWKDAYQDLLRRTTTHCDGKRLALKNPASTARIPQLLALYPDAKFVFIYRNPFSVFPSTRHLFKKAFRSIAFEQLSPEQNESNCLYAYERMMTAYLHQRSLVPKGNLVEVQYEALDQDPVEEMARVYDTLSLPGFDDAGPRMEEYMRSQIGYVKNKFDYPERDRELVHQRWQFALDEFGYTGPDV